VQDIACLTLDATTEHLAPTIKQPKTLYKYNKLLRNDQKIFRDSKEKQQLFHRSRKKE